MAIKQGWSLIRVVFNQVASHQVAFHQVVVFL